MNVETKIIYRTPKIEVLEKLQEADTLVFDLDDTLTTFKERYPNITRANTWGILEHFCGFREDKRFIALIKEYFELNDQKGQEGRVKEIDTQLNVFYKGKSEKELLGFLLPPPYFQGVKAFFDRIKSFDRKFFSAIISSAPSFFVKYVAEELKINFWEACMSEVDDKGNLTGNFKSNGLYGKGKSLTEFCERFSRNLKKTIYQGDHHYDKKALEIAGVGIAFQPVDGPEGEVAKASDVVLYDWMQHPLLEILEN